MCIDWFYELFLKSSQSGTYVPICLILNQTHIKTKISIKFEDSSHTALFFQVYCSRKDDHVEQIKRVDEGLLISSSVFLSAWCGKEEQRYWNLAQFLASDNKNSVSVNRQNILVYLIEPLPLRG